MSRSQTVTVVTDSAGAATEYSGKVRGRLLFVRYAKTDYTDGVDFTITTEDTVQNVWVELNVNASKNVSPRAGVDDTAGVAATLNGTQLMRDYVFCSNERIKIVLASGGNAKTGKFIIVTDE